MDFNRVEYKWYSLESRIGPRFADCYSAVTRNPKYAEHQADIVFLSQFIKNPICVVFYTKWVWLFKITLVINYIFQRQIILLVTALI